MMKFSCMTFVTWITVTVFTAQTEATMVIYGQMGKSVTLPKGLSGGNNVNVRWSRRNSQGKDEVVISQMSMGGLASIGTAMKDRVSLSRTDNSLIIKNLRPEDFTDFTCELGGSATYYKLYEITVNASPSLVLASQKFTLECTAEKSAAQTQVEWSGPSAQNIKDSRFISSAQTLTVSRVSWQDHGEWTCTVSYDNRKATATASVTVIELSPSSPHPIYPVQGSSTPSLLLPCSLHTRFNSLSLEMAGFEEGHWSFTPFSWDVTPEEPGGPQKILSLSLHPKLHWETLQGQRVNGTALDTDSSRTNLSILRNVGERGGTYTCTLDFKGGVTLSRSMSVEVLRIESSQGNSALEGRGLNLTCSLGHPSLLSNLTLKWIPPRFSSILPLLSPPHKPLLSIPRVTEKDKGTWQCKLRRGDTLLATAKLNLRTAKVPVDVWLLVSICGASVVVLLLLTLVFICVRRHRQKTFMRRRRKPKYCRCKHPQVKGFYKS
ncbi:hypothetical protein GJAV_G00006270 [Gymnothorax javanicus]|nr:hypothetical protein GJAV_G00006270 [Gymnothorax javanicus]